MARYLVYDYEQQLYVGSIQASRKKAEAFVKDFGPKADLHTLTEARRHYRDDENEGFWIYHSQFGAKYRCKLCCGEQLGKGGRHNHRKNCPLYQGRPKTVLVQKPHPPAPPVAKPMPLRSAHERVAPAQESLTDQMRRVLSWANRSGLYDAADWIHTRWSEAGGR